MDNPKSNIESSDEVAYPSAMRAWVALALLWLTSMLSYVDRMLLSSVIPLVRTEFSLSDTQLGSLTGLAFSLLYAFCGIPVGRMIDLHSRRTIIVVSIIVWSLSTAACGFATSYTSLFVARMGVGLGECGVITAIYSLLSDIFPPKKRYFVFGLLTPAYAVGMVAGLAIGGFLGELYGWRLPFIAVGLPGVVLALAVFLLVREPRRGAMDSAADPIHATTRSAINALAKNRIFLWIAISASANGFLIQGMVQWLPTYFHRVHDLSLSALSLFFGTVFGLSLACGLFVGGAIASRLARRNLFSPLYFLAVVNCASAPCYLLALWLQAPSLAIFATGLASFVGGLGFASQAGSIQNALPHNLRGIGHALVVFLTALVGGGIAPALVGALSDLLAPTAASSSLRYALSISQGILLLAGAAAYRAAVASKPTHSKS